MDTFNGLGLPFKDCESYYQTMCRFKKNCYALEFYLKYLKFEGGFICFVNTFVY